MVYAILSALLILFMYLVKSKMPKSSVSLEYFKGDLTLLEEEEIPTY